MLLRNVSDAGKVEEFLRKEGFSRCEVRKERDGAVLRVVFTKRSIAAQALALLKKNATTLGKNPVIELAAVAAQLADEKGAQLIVRNLIFSAEEVNVRKAFSKFGELTKVNLPRDAQTNKKRGLAFVQFADRKSATRALEAMNGATFCGRTIAVDWCVGKELFQEIRQGEKRVSGKELPAEPASTPALDKGKTAPALPTKAASSTPTGDKVEDMEEADESESESDKTSSAAKSADAEQDGKSTKPARPVDDCSHSVFVLNVPFDASENDVKHCFQKYGSVARAYLTPDNTGSGNPHRGTAFVRFLTKDGAEKTLDAEKSLKEKFRTLGGGVASKGALDGLGIVLKGRRLIVKKCEPREKTVEFADGKSRKEQRAAVRNAWSHLLKMGDLDENGAEFAELSRNEQNMRKHAVKEKKFKSGDPNYVINPLRLIVRNLPVGVEVQELREKIVSGGSQAVLAEGETKPSKEDRKKFAKTLTSVRVMRSDERRTQEGARRSLGFAFVEFASHEHALGVLKWLNNREGVFGKKPIVEFAFDDKRALRTQEKAKALQEKRAEEKAAAKKWAEEEGEDATMGNDAAKKGKKGKKRAREETSEEVGVKKGVEEPAGKKQKKVSKESGATAGGPKGAAGAEGEGGDDEQMKKLGRGAKQRAKKRDQKKREAEGTTAGVRKQQQMEKNEVKRQEKISERRAAKRLRKSGNAKKRGDVDDGTSLEERYLAKLR